MLPLSGSEAEAKEKVLEDVLQDTRRMVADALGDRINAEGAPEVTVDAQGGGAAQTLISAAAGNLLLVVGSRGLGGFRRLVLGSVSLQCVQHAPCPVTVVRSPDEEEH